MYTKPHKGLECWKRSREFVRTVYEHSRALPTEERFGITSQLRRAAVSIPLNIAEGAARRVAKGSNAEFLNFLNIALGSVAEVDTILDICSDLGFLPEPVIMQLQSQLDEIGRLLFGLMRSLKEK